MFNIIKKNFKIKLKKKLSISFKRTFYCWYTNKWSIHKKYRLVFTAIVHRDTINKKIEDCLKDFIPYNLTILKPSLLKTQHTHTNAKINTQETINICWMDFMFFFCVCFLKNFFNSCSVVFKDTHGVYVVTFSVSSSCYTPLHKDIKKK